MTEFVMRFLIGGIVVSTFSLFGEVFRPKSFAGIFGAAPSIALATVGVTILKHGKQYAAIEARSMLYASIAFSVYAWVTGYVLMRYKPHALTAAIALLPIWAGASFGLLFLFSR
jgi:Protein of unknown function (DUF3147)